MVRDKKEINELLIELEKLTGFIFDFGTEENCQTSDLKYASDIADTLNWVLENETTERFLSDAYLNIEELRKLASEIEKQTGRKLVEYE